MIDLVVNHYVKMPHILSLWRLYEPLVVELRREMTTLRLRGRAHVRRLFAFALYLNMCTAACENAPVC